MAADEDDWSNELEFDGSGGDTTDPWWLRLYRDPASDDIMFVWEQSIAGGAFLQTSLWDGDSWGAVTDHGETVLIDGLKSTQDFDFAWEGDRGEGVLAWFECDSGAGSCGGADDDLSNLEYNTWTSGSWDTKDTITADVPSKAKQGQVVSPPEPSNSDSLLQSSSCAPPSNVAAQRCARVLHPPPLTMRRPASPLSSPVRSWW